MTTAGDVTGTLPMWAGLLVFAYTISGILAFLSADKWSSRWWTAWLVCPIVIVGVCWLMVRLTPPLSV